MRNGGSWDRVESQEDGALMEGKEKRDLGYRETGRKASRSTLRDTDREAEGEVTRVM